VKTTLLPINLEYFPPNFNLKIFNFFNLLYSMVNGIKLFKDSSFLIYLIIK